MKKKFMMLAVLLGTLTLGSCIDDTESQSVTNVRDSKTEELKSIAAMEAAQAQAKITLANAEAAYKAALAEAEIAAAAKAQAEAELEKAQAELIELQKQAAEIENEADRIANEQAQAELEAKLAQLEVTKKENEAKLEKIAAEAEKQALINQKALVDAQKALNIAQDALNTQLANADAAEKKKLQDAADEYAQAVEDLISEQQTLINLKTDLVNLETGKENAQVQAEKDIAQYNEWIAENKAKIAIYQQYSNYQENWDAFYLEYQSAYSERSKLRDLQWAASNEYNNYQLDLTEHREALDALYKDPFYYFITNGRIAEENEDGTITGHWVYPVYNYMPTSWLNNPLSEIKLEQDDYTATYWMDSLALEINAPTTDVRKVELDVLAQLERGNNNLKNWEEALEKAQAQYNGKAVYGTGEYDDEGNEIMKEGLNAVDSCAVLKKAWEDLQADEDATEQEIADAKSAYENWLNNVELNQANNIKNYTQYVEDAEKSIARLETAWDFYKNFETYAAELQAKVDAINELIVKAHEENIALWKAERLAYWAYLDANTAYNALDEIYWGYNGGNGAAYIKNQIANWEAEIEGWETEKENVAKLMKWGSDYNYVWTEATYDEFIAWKKQQIEMQEIQVAVAEAKVAETKASLDELMPSTSTEEGAE